MLGLGEGSCCALPPWGCCCTEGNGGEKWAQTTAPSMHWGGGEEGGAEGWQQQCMLGVVVCKADALLLGASSRVTAPPPISALWGHPRWVGGEEGGG